MSDVKLITVSLKEDEHKALLEIMNVKNIKSLHAIVKIAINEFINHFKEKELHHRMPDGKLVE
ncbi:MAG: hypothetical protein QXU45_02830 [Candidatus Bathyarchaeia archaeon]